MSGDKFLSDELEKRYVEKIRAAEDIKKKQEEYKKANSFRLNTNTAYILNHKLFSGWDDFKEFIQTKHNQAWSNEIEFQIEVTFRVKQKRKKKK